jgi:hypothetical protein
MGGLIKSIVTPFVPDRVIQQITNQTKQQGSQSANVLISDGVFIKDVTVNGQTDVNHGLGRNYNGYLITSLSANISVWTTDSGMQDKILRLTSTGSVVISLWVF